MTKRHANSLLTITQGFLLDALAIDKTLAKDLERDYSRLESLVREHGIAVFTVLLPALAKGLDRSLDACFLDVSGLPLSRPVSTSTVVPRLFRGLWLKVFTKSGVLRDEAVLDPTFVLILKNILTFGKKIELECSPKAVFTTTKEFFHVDAILPRPSQFWSDCESNLDRVDTGSILDLVQRDLGGSFGGVSDATIEPLLRCCQQVADIIVTTRFGREISPESWVFKHGPGATSEIPRGKGYKYSFPTWSPRLESSLPYDLYGVSSMENAQGDNPSSHHPVESDYPSRLCCVPKDMRGPRLIAAEPTANQWAQQGLADHIVGCIRRFPEDIGGSITFHNQSNSAYMALSGSRTAKLATVDLSSASDRLSCWLVQRIFRGNLPLLRLLANTRTRFMMNEVDVKMPKIVELNKFATMGSALTFPVQSVVFFVLTAAAVVYSRGLRPTDWALACGSVQVYGDDIVVPVDALDSLRALLSAVGLKVNVSKTFSGRNFREACGIEAFRGYDCTPAKPRHLFDSDGSVSLISCIDVANLLHERGLWHSAQKVRTLAGEVGSIPMTRTGSGVWSDKSFVDPWTTDSRYQLNARMRWNHELHRYEYRFVQPKAVTTSSRRVEGHGNLLQFFTEEPWTQDLSSWESGVTSVSDAATSPRWVSADSLSKESRSARKMY